MLFLEKCACRYIDARNVQPCESIVEYNSLTFMFFLAGQDNPESADQDNPEHIGNNDPKSAKESPEKDPEDTESQLLELEYRARALKSLMQARQTLDT